MVIRNFISGSQGARTIVILLDSECHFGSGLISRIIFPSFLLLLLFICGLRAGSGTGTERRRGGRAGNGVAMHGGKGYELEKRNLGRGASGGKWRMTGTGD